MSFYHIKSENAFEKYWLKKYQEDLINFFDKKAKYWEKKANKED